MNKNYNERGFLIQSALLFALAGGFRKPGIKLEMGRVLWISGREKRRKIAFSYLPFFSKSLN